MQTAAPELCPFCRNQNPDCQYFEPDILSSKADWESELITASHNLGDFPGGSFWGRVKQALTGTMVTIKIAKEETAIDLGANLRCGGYYFDLFGPWEEIPVIKKIAGKFGLSIKWDEKEDKAASKRFMAVSVAVLQPRGIGFIDLDETFQEILDQKLIQAIDKAADESRWINYFDYQWKPLYFDPKVPEILAPGGEQEKEPNALALVNWRTIYGWEEMVYRKWADMEERLILDSFSKVERKYDCSDLPKARQDFIKEGTDIRTELKSLITV